MLERKSVESIYAPCWLWHGVFLFSFVGEEGAKNEQPLYAFGCKDSWRRRLAGSCLLAYHRIIRRAICTDVFNIFAVGIGFAILLIIILAIMNHK